MTPYLRMATPEDGQVSVWFSSPSSRAWSAPSTGAGVRDFHRSLPGYAVTPLVDLPALAEELGVGRVLVKDESARLGLPAFKVLGASWACHRVLQAQPGARLVTATDGNHGRAVARMASQLGVSATVFLPDVTRPETAAAIAAEGAEVVQLDVGYDDTVRAAATYADAAPDRALVQDTAWDGYDEEAPPVGGVVASAVPVRAPQGGGGSRGGATATDDNAAGCVLGRRAADATYRRGLSVPGWIVEGYQTMLEEIDEQLGRAPDLVAVPTGVGSLAEAVVRHYRRDDAAHPSVLSVEPDTAACVLASLTAGHPVTVPTGATVMAGLNCGTASSNAWPVLRDGCDAAVAVSDHDALTAVAGLAALGISSGPSGAATLAGIRAALGMPERRADLGLPDDAVVVLLSTEGNHDHRGHA